MKQPERERIWEAVSAAYDRGSGHSDGISNIVDMLLEAQIAVTEPRKDYNRWDRAVDLALKVGFVGGIVEWHRKASEIYDLMMVPPR